MTSPRLPTANERADDISIHAFAIASTFPLESGERASDLHGT